MSCRSAWVFEGRNQNHNDDYDGDCDNEDEDRNPLEFLQEINFADRDGDGDEGGVFRNLGGGVSF